MLKSVNLLLLTEHLYGFNDGMDVVKRAKIIGQLLNVCVIQELTLSIQTLKYLKLNCTRR